MALLYIEMSSAKAIRDMKLEELRRVKARNVGSELGGAGIEKNRPLDVPSNPFATKAETWPENQDLGKEKKVLGPEKKIRESGELGLSDPSQVPELASSKPIPSKSPFIFTRESFPVPLELLEPEDDQDPDPDLDLDDLTLKYLNQQLEILELAENSLKDSTERLHLENEQLRKEKEKFDLNMESLIRNSEVLLGSLEVESEKVMKKIGKYENLKGNVNKASVNKEIEELNNELDFFYLQSEEKEEEIERLKKEIHRANEEAKNLQSLFNDGTYLSQPEPPSPRYNSLMDSHLQSPRRLLSDMGSTGAWNNKKKKT